MKKMPPIQKILEAYTAIVDKHVELKNNEALVTSSNGAKTYTVSWDNDIYHSNDNATYWQGYAGYPIIAVLMLQGKIPFDQKLADNFASVNWNEVNAKFKRNYAKAASEVIKKKGLDEKLYFTRDLQYSGRHLLRCRVKNSNKNVDITKIFIINCR